MADIKDVIDTLDFASDFFDTALSKSQKKIYDEALVLIKELDLEDGKVKQTIANLKRLNVIKAKLAKIANNKDYLAAVGSLVGVFDKLQQEQNAYFSQHFPENTLGEKAKEKHKLMKQMAVQNTIEALTGDGLKANVTDKLNEILLRAVTSHAKFADLQEEFRAHLLGQDGGTGALARYAGTYAVTAMSQFTGQNNKLLTQDLGCEWFMYVGSTIETTREFCQKLTAKKYVHISEIPAILAGDIDGEKCAIYKKTGLPYGLIEGTNEENFQVNCGGWNCRHQLVPVHELAVPQAIRDKFAKKEEPKQETQELQLTQKQADDMAIIKQYAVDHPKSEKIANYIKEIEEKKKAGSSDEMQALISAAIKDIKKFNAAKKVQEKKAAEKAKIAEEKAKAEEEAKKNQAAKDWAEAVLELGDAYSKVSNYNIDHAEVQATIQSHDTNKAKALAKELTELKAKVTSLANIVSPEGWAAAFTYEELKQADDYVKGHMIHWTGKGKKGETLIKAINDEVNLYLNKSHKTYAVVKHAFEEKIKELQKQVKQEAINSDIAKIKQYTIDHPKSAKLANAYAEILKEKAKVDATGADDTNLKNLIADAIKDIKKFDAAKAATAKKKGTSKTSGTTTDGGLDLTNEKESNYQQIDQFENDHTEVSELSKLINILQKVHYSSSITKQKGNALHIKYASLLAAASNDPQKYEKEIKDALKEIKNFIKSGYEKKEIQFIGIPGMTDRYWCSPYETDRDYYDFITTSGVYSASRKKQAAIFEEEMKALDFTFEETNFRSTWKSATDEQKEASDSYTRASGAITKYLRGIKRWYESSSAYADKSKGETEALTELINKTMCKYDVWLKRDEKHDFCDYRWGIRIEDYRTHMSDLIGKVGTDESFMSCGNNTNTYFSGTGTPDVELRIFCPAGTRMLPEEPQGYYSQYKIGWDGNKKPSWTAENEIVLQRGTKMRITNAKYDPVKQYYYIACEILSQNPRPFDTKYVPGEGYRAEYK